LLDIVLEGDVLQKLESSESPLLADLSKHVAKVLVLRKEYAIELDFKDEFDMPDGTTVLCEEIVHDVVVAGARVRAHMAQEEANEIMNVDDDVVYEAASDSMPVLGLLLPQHWEDIWIHDFEAEASSLTKFVLDPVHGICALKIDKLALPVKYIEELRILGKLCRCIKSFTAVIDLARSRLLYTVYRPLTC